MPKKYTAGSAVDIDNAREDLGTRNVFAIYHRSKGYGHNSNGHSIRLHVSSASLMLVRRELLVKLNEVPML